MKRLVKKLLVIIDYFIFIPVIISGVVLKLVRLSGTKRMKISRNILTRLGVFPIIDHYYEPLFNQKKLSTPLSQKRNLPGIDWNLDSQLRFLKNLKFTDEISRNGWKKYANKKFFFGNGSIESGDAEYLYNMVRFLKPKNIIEIGSGYSTLISKQAIEENIRDNNGDTCIINCIEPFEQPWLEELEINITRLKVENVDVDLFQNLNKNDLLFIDSSHIIRPQGDVTHEILNILPTLKPGVYVHFHDIFSPNDYPSEWLFEHMRFWNEQYLLEAFLTNNSSWEIVGALNLLSKHHYDELKIVCKYLDRDRDPGSLYIRKK
jgi:hypothetical protein